MSATTDESKAQGFLSEESQAIDADPANDFPELTPEVLATARKGFFAEHRHMVKIADDLWNLFPSEESVNEALRLVAKLAQIPRRQAVEPSEPAVKV